MILERDLLELKNILHWKMSGMFLERSNIFRRIFSLLFLLLPATLWGQSEKCVTPQNISKAVAAAEGGDTICIRKGDYDHLVVKIEKKEFDQPVIIRSEEPGQVKISGQFEFRVTDSKNLRFEGFYFTKTEGSTFILNGSSKIEIVNNYFYACGIKPTHSVIRIVNGSFDNTIIRNTFDALHSQGILIATYADNPKDSLNKRNKILYNRFHNTPGVKKIYPQLPRNGMESIMIGFGGDKTRYYKLYTLVKGNIFDNIVGDGNEIISNKTSGNKIIENSFFNNRAGLVIRAGNTDTIAENYFYNNLKSITLYGMGHLVQKNQFVNSHIGVNIPAADFSYKQNHDSVGYSQGSDIKVRDNIFIQSKKMDVLIGDKNRRLYPKDIEVHNNSFINSRKRMINAQTEKNSLKLMDNKFQYSGRKLKEAESQRLMKNWSLEEEMKNPHESGYEDSGCTWLTPKQIKEN